MKNSLEKSVERIQIFAPKLSMNPGVQSFLIHNNMDTWYQKNVSINTFPCNVNIQWLVFTGPHISFLTQVGIIC